MSNLLSKDLVQATAALQRALGGHGVSRKAISELGTPTGSRASRASFGVRIGKVTPLPTALSGFLDGTRRSGFGLPSGRTDHLAPTGASFAVPEGAKFLAMTYSNQAGSRPYKLFIPSGYCGQPVPLIVMLHGCTQSPDDFAVGTGMNIAAEEQTCLVAYPGQVSSANMQKCWNWFSEGDQQRDSGEPSLIAGITREVMREYAVDPQRVYVAGLSAGGAAAAVMGDAYPDLYAAIGVHSGLACGAARDMPSAFAAMQRGSEGSTNYSAAVPRTGTRRRLVPTIVFHGDRDTTVNPRNGDAVVAQSRQGTCLQSRVEQGQVFDGYAYDRTLHMQADGHPVIEQWLVHGAGHAWFGGSPAGSYTDKRGPNATGEMLRFFLEHPHLVATQGDQR